MDVLCAVCETGGLKDHEDELEGVIDFFSDFMNGYHHGKEENYVFPLLREASPQAGDELDELLADHNKVRSIVSSMRSSLQDMDLESFSEQSKELVASMRKHIKREEDEIFPLIEQTIDPELDVEMFQKSQEFAAKKFGSNFQNDMQNFADRFQESVMGKGIVRYDYA